MNKLKKLAFEANASFSSAQKNSGSDASPPGIVVISKLSASWHQPVRHRAIAKRRLNNLDRYWVGALIGGTLPNYAAKGNVGAIYSSALPCGLFPGRQMSCAI